MPVCALQIGTLNRRRLPWLLGHTQTHGASRHKTRTLMPFSLFDTARKRRARRASDSGDAPASESMPEHQQPPSSVTQTRQRIVERLRRVIDPEVGLNIVDLGLIYDLQVEDDTATVRLTMTTPACPMSSYIKQQVGRALQKVPGLRRGIIELVWDPPWSPQMMDPEASSRRFGVRYQGGSGGLF